MTYSHNNVSNNLKMTTTAAAAASTIRLKNVSANGVSGGGDFRLRLNRKTPSPPIATPITAHSNSIASSTNYHQQQHYHQYHNQQQQQQHALSSSPPGSFMSSAASTISNCSSSSGSSLGSTGNGSGGNYYATRQRQQQRNWQQQQQQQQQQRHSPQQLGSGSFFGNNQQYCQQQQGGGGVRRHGSAQKQRDAQHSPNNARQSPAVILAGGSHVNGSGRKQRGNAKHSVNQSPLICGGKVSPTMPPPLIPTALTHFAGSKCFDAPAPTALPKPPEHWTLGKAEQKSIVSSAGPGLHSVVTARHSAVDAHTYGGHVVKSSKRNLLDDFDTHNLKLLLNVQS